jgi:DNA-3-methyladenine glycosylase II
MTKIDSWSGTRVYTVGHSTRALDEFVALLVKFDISVLVDIRTIPRSRHNPQFDGEALRSSLPSRFRYVQLPELGGLRRPSKDSPNTAWRNASFRGFADYMGTHAFETGLEKLRATTSWGRVALMCAEAVPWRCHRSLVADALTVRGAHVEHITSINRSMAHHITEFAVVTGKLITYPCEDPVGERLVTRAPFSLEATVRVLQRRPTSLVDVWAEERYLRVLPAEGTFALVEVRNRGTIDEPDVRFTVLSGNRAPETRTALVRRVRKMLGLDVETARPERLARAERALRPTALALRGMRPPRFADLFESFARVVPFQQLTLDAGEAIVARMVERFGTSFEHEPRIFAFPTAQIVAAAGIDRIKGCGMSRRKADTLYHTARAIESGALSEEKLELMSDEEATRALLDIPGIGPWSAALVLLRGLGRLHVFPPGDVGAMRGLMKLTCLTPGPPLERLVRRFGDHRGYLYFYALGGALLAKGLIHAAR